MKSSCGSNGVCVVFTAKTTMQNIVKEYMKQRREDKDKAERLFIDSILDCEFMDEGEVCVLKLLTVVLSIFC